VRYLPTLAAIGGGILGASLIAWALVQTLDAAFADSYREPRLRAAFIKGHPCPAKGKPSGACTGYVVGYIKPRCAGGPDRLTNLQWQKIRDARLNDREERRICAKG
jgi:hypothetical protein